MKFESSGTKFSETAPAKHVSPTNDKYVRPKTWSIQTTYLGGIVFFKKHGDVSSQKTLIFCTLRKEQHKLKGDCNSCWCLPEKIADISRRHHWLPNPCEMTSQKRPQKFHTDDASLPRFEQCFRQAEANFPRGATNQTQHLTTTIKMSLLYVFVIFVGLETIETLHIFIHI